MQEESSGAPTPSRQDVFPVRLPSSSQLSENTRPNELILCFALSFMDAENRGERTVARRSMENGEGAGGAPTSFGSCSLPFSLYRLSEGDFPVGDMIGSPTTPAPGPSGGWGGDGGGETLSSAPGRSARSFVVDAMPAHDGHSSPHLTPCDPCHTPCTLLRPFTPPVLDPMTSRSRSRPTNLSVRIDVSSHRHVHIVS